jgi:nicotinamide riboside kinase
LQKNKRIIGFCGASATGKTTLAQWFVENYPDQIDLCSENARESAVELGINSISDIKPEQRELFQKLILEKHLSALAAFKESEKSIMICDRTVIDIFAYTYRAKRDLDQISEEFYDYLADTCKIKYYTSVIYFDLIEMDESKMDDGFRTSDLIARRLTAHDITFYLREFGVDFMRISDSWSDRVKFLKWHLGLEIGVLEKKNVFCRDFEGNLWPDK